MHAMYPSHQSSVSNWFTTIQSSLITFLNWHDFVLTPITGSFVPFSKEQAFAPQVYDHLCT